MKKLFNKIISLISVLALSVGFLSGCQLISTDAEKDMALTVATVSIDDGLEDIIYKKDIVSEFNNSGYLYMYYYGYTQKQTYELILKEIVQNRIILQQARKALTGATSMPGNETGYFAQAKAIDEDDRTNDEKALTIKDFTSVQKTDSLDKFLTDYEILQAKYKSLTAVDNLIKSYIDEDEETHDHKYESFNITTRATLAVEGDKTGNEWELQYDDEIKVVTETFKKDLQKTLNELNITVENTDTKYSLNKKVYEGFINKFDDKIKNDKEYRRAFNKALKDLKKYGYISSSEAQKTYTSSKVDDGVLSISFFNDTLVQQYENLVVAKYELALINQEEKNINKEGVLYGEYVALYDSQKALYDGSYTAYESALESATEDTFIVYNPGGSGNKKYGYIANLLIGFNDEQLSALETYSSKQNINDSDVINYRKELLKNLKVKDMRETWVMSNYGTYNETTKKFTFKKEYCPTEQLRTFGGTFNGAQSYIYHDSNDVEVTGYNFKAITPNEVSFMDFYNNTMNSIMGFSGFSGKLTGDISYQTSVSTLLKDDILKKYRDLIFAYSTDDGSLQENYGYLYSPFTSKTKYVEEYADAAERLINDADKGVGAYEVVATKYGYHIMLCTSVLVPNTVKLSSEEFENLLAAKDSLPYKFREYKINLVSSSRISDITSAFINGNYNDDQSEEDGRKVVYNVKAYEDLLVE